MQLFFTAEVCHGRQLFYDAELAMNLTLITCCQLLWRCHGLFCCVGATPAASHSEPRSPLSSFSDWQTHEAEWRRKIHCDSYCTHMTDSFQIWLMLTTNVSWGLGQSDIATHAASHWTFVQLFIYWAYILVSFNLRLGLVVITSKSFFATQYFASSICLAAVSWDKLHVTYRPVPAFVCLVFHLPKLQHILLHLPVYSVHAACFSLCFPIWSIIPVRHWRFRQICLFFIHFLTPSWGQLCPQASAQLRIKFNTL